MFDHKLLHAGCFANFDSSVDAEEPNLLLMVGATASRLDDGRWRFELRRDGESLLEAHDEEPGDINRLTLLATVRGLEAIDGPSQLTLLSTNRYLIRSLTESLPRWRRFNFTWEQFGQTAEVQNADLWRRVDAAVRIHRVAASLLSVREVPPADLPAVARPRVPAAGPADDRVPTDPRRFRIDGPHAHPAPGRAGPTIRMRRRSFTPV